MTENTIDKIDAFGEFMSRIIDYVYALLRFQLVPGPNRDRINVWVRRAVLVTLPISWPILAVLYVFLIIFTISIFILIIIVEMFWKLVKTMWAR